MFPDLTAFLATFANPDAILRDHVPDHPDARRPSCVACSIGQRSVAWPCALHIGGGVTVIGPHASWLHSTEDDHKQAETADPTR